MKPEAYPKVQAVTAPSVDADVVFDFNDNASWYRHGPLRDGWTLGVASRLSAAGDARTAWGNRRVSFALQMRGNRSMIVAAQSTLARWLLGAEGWVLFQLDAMSPPVWLRMLGAEPQDLDFDLVRGDKGEDVWTLGITFDADPFLYGERVALFDRSVGNDPTIRASSEFIPDGMCAPLGDVPGDAPMLLQVTLSEAGDTPGPWASAYRIHAISHAAADNGMRIASPASGGEFIGDAPGAHPTTVVADEAYVGGMARSIPFSASAGAVAMSDQFAVRINNPIRLGDYRVYARISASAAGAMRFAFKHGPARMALPSVRFGPTQTPEAWYEIGEYTHPIGGLSAAAHQDAGLDPTEVMVSASRTTPSGVLRISAIMLVPVRRNGTPDSRTLISGGIGLVTEGAVYGQSDHVAFDTATETAWMVTPSGAYVGTGRSHHGGWPVASPGSRTTLLLMRGAVGDIAPSDHFNDPTAEPTHVKVTGQPQWLYLPNHQEA